MPKIITFNHPTLKKKAKQVKPGAPELKKIIREMKTAMTKEDGIGFAAPQINQSKRLIIIKTGERPLVLLNPRLTRKSLKKNNMEEGCLSFPGYYGEVKRPAKVKVCFYDQKGKKILMSADGLMARVLQHEIDHLNGQLFIYKVKKFTKGNPDELWNKMQS